MNRQSDRPKSCKRNRSNTRGRILLVGALLILLILLLVLFTGKNEKGSAAIETTSETTAATTADVKEDILKDYVFEGKCCFMPDIRDDGKYAVTDKGDGTYELTGDIYDAIYDPTAVDGGSYQKTVVVKENVTLVIDKETTMDYGDDGNNKEKIEKWLFGKEPAELSVQGIVELSGYHIDVYKFDKFLS